MKFIHVIWLFAFSASVNGSEVRLRVIDEAIAPVSDADATVIFVAPHQEQSETHSGKSNSEGYFSATGQAVLWVYVEAKKDGYYGSRIDNLPSGKAVDRSIILRRRINPIPLFAKRSYDPVSGRTLTVPSQDSWIGYDFEAGDWVSPHGKGKTADILFLFKNTFKGWKYSEREMADSRRTNRALSEAEFRLYYGKWEGDLEISFPGEQEGLYEESERFLSYSQMKMPHEAPPIGYQAKLRCSANSFSPSKSRGDVGFFLRTRVKQNAKGEIVSANFTKIIGDFHFSPETGAIQFLYYFNPVPNDRNLEFDPKKNLFPANFPGANVSDP
jgi:hypothetical protein